MEEVCPAVQEPLDVGCKCEEGLSEQMCDEKEEKSPALTRVPLCNMEKRSVDVKKEESEWESTYLHQESVSIKTGECESESTLNTNMPKHELVNSVKEEDDGDTKSETDTLRSCPDEEAPGLGFMLSSPYSLQDPSVHVKCEPLESDMKTSAKASDSRHSERVEEVKVRTGSLEPQCSRPPKPKPSGSREKSLGSEQRWPLNNMQVLRKRAVPPFSKASLRNVSASSHVRFSARDQLSLQSMNSSDEGVFDTSDSATGDSPITVVGCSSLLPPDSQLTSSEGQSASLAAPSIENIHNKKAPKREALDDDTELLKLPILKEKSAIVLAQLKPRHDSDSLFGQLVATELQQIRSLILRTRAKKRIMTLLYEFQEREWHDENAVRRISEHHVSFQTRPESALANVQHLSTHPDLTFTQVPHGSEPRV
ncbi:uncharacterized protein LOC114667774 [Erpetoichthys calabaricus]|uniref:uncharacterized protein LOC114667774 n=1 Tax=Erpetoichthys calabaricus TaxID=27687 RepID=UPI002234E1D7|nr:uncharacterized protein LOC114667774 [Erpetoichthys calabaricus]